MFEFRVGNRSFVSFVMLSVKLIILQVDVMTFSQKLVILLQHQSMVL